MSFQAYLNTIETKTGKSPAALRAYAESKDWLAGDMLRPDVKPGVIVADLKAQFALGHGHAMAVVALLKGIKREGDS